MKREFRLAVIVCIGITSGRTLSAQTNARNNLTVTAAAQLAQTDAVTNTPPPIQTNTPVVTVAATASSGATNCVTIELAPNSRSFFQSLNEDKWFKKDVLFSTLAGGALAILGGFLAALCADWLQGRQKQRDDEQFMRNVLRAIRRELEAIGNVYDHGIGAHLAQLEDGRFFGMRLGLTQDWFTIFHANAVHLGKIEGEISRKIVTVYIHAKQLIEEFRLNNEGLIIRANLLGRQHAEPMNALLHPQIVFVEQELVLRAAGLKQIAAKLKAANEDLLANFDQRGIK